MRAWVLVLPLLLFDLEALEDQAGQGSQDSQVLPHCCLPGVGGRDNSRSEYEGGRERGRRRGQDGWTKRRQGFAHPGFLCSGALPSRKALWWTREALLGKVGQEASGRHMTPHQDCQLPQPSLCQIETSGPAPGSPPTPGKPTVPARLCPVPTLAQLSKPGTPGMPWSPFSPFSRRKAGRAVWPWAQFPQML